MRRFIDEESGMTMALAMMMILLIGVMGAGLLTFVSRDLNSVVEANQGTRAQEAADAGLEAAKRHLQIKDALPSRYEVNDTAEPTNSPWYDNAADNQSGASGQTLTFNGNEILVGIRYLDVSRTEAEARDPDNAPEVLPTYFKVVNGVTEVDPCNDVDGDGIDDDTNTDETDLDPDACNYENGRNYFRVTARYLPDGTGDAIRVVQAIYKTENFGSVPLSYYASRNIQIDGGADITNMSIFARGNISGVSNVNPGGIDHSYGDWANLPGDAGPNAYNATPRTDDEGVPVIAAGVGAQGTIIYGANDKSKDHKDQKALAGSPQVYGYRDYDRDTDQLPTTPIRPEFAVNDWGDRANQLPTKITYPFAPPDPTEDAQAMAVLKEKAQAQANYVLVPPGGSYDIDNPDYPMDSDLNNTVFFVEFADGTEDAPQYGDKGLATYRAEGNDDVTKGVIVVMNGDLSINDSADPFQGAMIVRDPVEAGNDTDTTGVTCNRTGTVMDFCSSGKVPIEGWINVQSDISIRGTADGFLPSEMATGLSSLVKVSQWSWRECYNTTCN